MVETGLEELTAEARGMLADVRGRMREEFPAPAQETRVKEASFRAEQGWPDKPAFVPRPDPEVARGVEVADPGARASARLEHLRGWGGPDVLRAMGWPDKAAELERLEAEHAARLNTTEAFDRLLAEMAQMLPSGWAKPLLESILRELEYPGRTRTVRANQARMRALRDLRRADRLRAVAGRETNRGKKRGRKAAWGAWEHPRKASGKARNQRLPGGPEGA